MLSIRDLDTDIGGLGKRTIIIEAVTLFLATVGLCLRLWARSIGRRSLCLNDYFIMFAWVSRHLEFRLNLSISCTYGQC